MHSRGTNTDTAKRLAQVTGGQFSQHHIASLIARHLAPRGLVLVRAVHPP
jgi:hypothetical protein